MVVIGFTLYQCMCTMPAISIYDIQWTYKTGLMTEQRLYMLPFNSPPSATQLPGNGEITIKTKTLLYQKILTCTDVKKNFIWPHFSQVRVTAPSDAIVSTYKVTVKVFLKDDDGEEQRFVANIDDEMYLLFNPWDERELRFYISIIISIYFGQNCPRSNIEDGNYLLFNPWDEHKFNRAMSCCHNS